MTGRERGRQSGFATLQYVGAVLVASALAAAFLPFASPASARVAHRFYCAITSVTQFPANACAEGDPDDPAGPGSPGSPDDPDVPTVGPDDRWPGSPDPENPENPDCKDKLPSSGELDADEPTLVQVGCRELYVPKGCEAEWAAYQGATPGRSREEAAGPLATCVREKYDSMEPVCVVNATTEIDRTEIQILFFKIDKSYSMLIEKLGDGRVRAHLLKGAQLGGAASGEVANVSFNVAGISGYEDDTTYEFADVTTAQAWLDWYKSLRATKESLKPTPMYCYGGACAPQVIAQGESRKRLEELKRTEPPFHRLATANSRVTKVKLEGGVKLPVSTGGKKGGSGGPSMTGAPAIEGSYTGEVQVEERRWSDGSRTASYKSSDAGGFLIGMKAGGKGTKKSDKEDGKPEDQGGGTGSFSWGKDWAGTTQTSVTWGPDGELSKLIVTMDEQSMQTLEKAGVDLNVVLPYGFGASYSHSQEKKEGTASATEMILDFNQYPELREKLGPTIDQMFPREDDGSLKKGDVRIDFDDDAEQEAVHDAVKDAANVRRLDYDVTESSRSDGGGIDLAGIDLFKATYTHVENTKDLSESSFEVKDVNGDRKTVRPAPKCRDEGFVATPGYFESGFSDPPTP